MIVGVAAIVGGIIGAVIGSSHHHHSSSGSLEPSGSSGEPGPAGPVCPPSPSFTNNPGQSLTFNLSLDIFGVPQIIDNGVHFSGPLLAFVTGPDGNTFGAPPIVLTDVLFYHEEFFAPIVIENPVFGQYQAGVQIIGYTSKSFDATLHGGVDVSRDGSTTNLADISFETPTFVQQLQGAMLFS